MSELTTPPPAPVAYPESVPVGQHYDTSTAVAVGSRLPGPSPTRFEFDGGAGSYVLVGIGSFLLAVCTLGLALPWAVCMTYRWRTEHTLIDGRRLRFTGSGASLFGHWIKWWALTIVTFGIYSFWVYPRLVRWMTEKQTF